MVGGWQSQTLYLTEGYYPQSSLDFLAALGSDRIDTFKLSTNWNADTRNDFLTPTAGSYQNFGVELALPGSSARYFKMDYRYGRYIGLGRSICSRARSWATETTTAARR